MVVEPLLEIVLSLGLGGIMGFLLYRVAVDEKGLLTKVGYTLTGVHPRNFTLTADNRFLLVALRDSNSVEVYARDEKTGLLTRTAISLELSHPVCLLWM